MTTMWRAVSNMYHSFNLPCISLCTCFPCPSLLRLLPGQDPVGLSAQETNQTNYYNEFTDLASTNDLFEQWKLSLAERMWSQLAICTDTSLRHEYIRLNLSHKRNSSRLGRHPKKMNWPRLLRQSAKSVESPFGTCLWVVPSLSGGLRGVAAGQRVSWERCTVARGHQAV